RVAAVALPGQGFVRPAVNLFTIVAETAGAGGLKIAETFPEGRGSPHGCGLRAVFCMDATSCAMNDIAQTINRERKLR
ncbi:hypothetical protein, partial [Klebsiella quasipneumoniae]|uniref:hypothetical protein n=1 Tax=Klebsiella quasipneumoniae TaxID=1463165 RepID=UPI00197B34BE